ncbi:hypothetical protein GCM10027343_02380 [Noviherbaspirillum agri]
MIRRLNATLALCFLICGGISSDLHAQNSNSVPKNSIRAEVAIATDTTKQTRCKKIAKKIATPDLKGIAVRPVEMQNGVTVIYQIDINNDGNKEKAIISSGSQETSVEIEFQDGGKYFQSFIERLRPIIVDNKTYLVGGHTTDSWRTLKGVSIYFFVQEQFEELCNF